MAYRRPAWANRRSQENSPAAAAMANKNAIKVIYLQQFVRDFLRPYGSATSARVATDSDFRTKLQPFTCEWLCRPSVAESETAAIIAENIEKTQDLIDLYMAKDHIVTFRKKAETIQRGQC